MLHIIWGIILCNIMIKRGIACRGRAWSTAKLIIACHMACNKLVSWASLASLEARVAHKTSDKPQMSTQEITDPVIQKPAGIWQALQRHMRTVKKELLY